MMAVATRASNFSYWTSIRVARLCHEANSMTLVVVIRLTICRMP